METFYKILLGFIVTIALITLVKNNFILKNEIEKCYKENYTFVYKQETLSDDLVKQLLDQLSNYNCSEEKKIKETKEFQFVNSIFIPERKIVLQVDRDSKTVQIARIKYGSKEYENAQILYQQGYQIIHNDKKLSEKETNKLFDKMQYDHDYMLKEDIKNKTLTVIDP